MRLDTNFTVRPHENLEAALTKKKKNAAKGKVSEGGEERDKCWKKGTGMGQVGKSITRHGACMERLATSSGMWHAAQRRRWKGEQRGGREIVETDFLRHFCT